MGWLETLAHGGAAESASPVDLLRQRALASVARRGLPTVQMEAWKYTDLHALGEFALATSSSVESINQAGVPLLSASPRRLVFVNGLFDSSWSALGEMPGGVTVRPLSQALGEDPETVRAALARHTDDDSQIFAALNAGTARDGALIELAANSTLASPLLVVFVNTPGSARLFTSPLVIVKAGANSQLTLLEVHYGEAGARNLSSALTDITAGSGSSIDHYRLQVEAAEALHLANLRLDIGDNARVASHSFAFGARLARLDIIAELNAPGANVVLNGLFHARAGQHIDHQTCIDHRAPHTTSTELYKGLASDNGRGVFRGQVIVRPNAQKTSARQASHNLLLSPNAEIDTKPELEIYADDVACAHGATVGQLDADALFYLRSRGIPEAEAHALLVFAFTEEVIEQVGFPPLRDWLATLLAGSAEVPLPEKMKVEE